MPSRKLVVAVILAAHAVSSPALAQSPATVAASAIRAGAILDSAIAAHGGLESLRAARQIRVSLEGHDVHRGQSRLAGPPYDRDAHRVDLMIDLEHSRLSFERTFAYPGGIHRTQRFLTDGERSYLLNRGARTYAPQRYPPAQTQLGNLFYLPQFVLLTARERPEMLRYLGRMVLGSGATVEVITAPIPNNALMTLAFDPATRRLRALLSVRGDALAGDAAVETEFPDYRTIGGVLLPTRRVTRVAGEVTQDLAYTAARPGFVMPDSLAAPPAGWVAAPGDAQIEPVRTLAPGVWAIGGTGANTLAVAFSDYVLLVDAPPFGAGDVLAHLDSLAPGKPIRYVIPTHHHDDHAGGVGRYAARGATIVTTAGNRDLLSRMAAVRPRLGTPSPTAPAASGRIEIVRGRRVFSDGTRTVEIHETGPGPHAEEMLVAWIPEEGILFQGDLIDVGANGAILPGTNNQTTVHFARWLLDRGWTVRVFAGAHGFLPNPAAFTEVLRQPVVPTAASH